MIGKSKSISHGINLLGYITGESKNKKHPELIYHIKDNLLPPGLDAMGIWEQIKLKTAPFQRIKNNVIRFEVSPPPEYVKDFTGKDWEKLWDDFLQEYDNYEHFDKKTGKVDSPKTNIAGSIYSLWLHTESKSGIPHLHCAASRVDENNRINNDHMIHIRAQIAAERVARKRGWKTAKKVREKNIEKVGKDCMNILQKMQEWDMNNYFSMLRNMGYKVVTRPDKQGGIHGYALVMGTASYKASDLGKGRKLTVANLPKTWNALHPTGENKISTKTKQGETKPIAKTQQIPAHDYSQWETGTVPYTIHHEGESYKYYLPEKVMNLFEDEYDYRTVSNSVELTNLAAAIFVELAALNQAPVIGGGGGSQSELPWRDKDEDDMKWARRCMDAASRHLGKKPKTGIRR
ncbi:relaxase [Bacteroides caccae]|uniref:relaxase n=1 Tax=Bacteroides caccae TaxID=47678 RepID=UPI003219FD94